MRLCLRRGLRSTNIDWTKEEPCSLQRIPTRPHVDAQCEQAQDRPVRRELLVGARGHPGAGALVGQLAGQSQARHAWRTRPASISCCRSGAGRAMAATPTTRARRSRPSPGRPGLLASTKRITVFGTVHAPLFNPIIAAKEMVTADHIGEGRFGLNIVVGWNEGEFEMFGVTAARSRAALRIRAGMDRRHQDDLVGQGGLRLPRPIPRPEGHPRQAEALWRHAAGDHECRRLAGRPGVRDPQLRCFLPAGLAHLARRDRAEGRRPPRARRKEQGRELGVYTVGVITCRPTKKEAEDYYHYSIVEHADWSAVDGILALKNITRAEHAGRRSFSRCAPATRKAWAACRSSAIPTTWRSAARRSQQGGADRDRRLAGQLCRRAAVLLRRGAAAARAHGPRARSVIEREWRLDAVRTALSACAAPQ